MQYEPMVARSAGQTNSQQLSDGSAGTFHQQGWAISIPPMVVYSGEWAYTSAPFRTGTT
jgi:hypothetical protein